jgi:hypothetical protein
MPFVFPFVTDAPRSTRTRPGSLQAIVAAAKQAGDRVFPDAGEAKNRGYFNILESGILEPVRQ